MTDFTELAALREEVLRLREARDAVLELHRGVVLDGVPHGYMREHFPDEYERGEEVEILVCECCDGIRQHYTDNQIASVILWPCPTALAVGAQTVSVDEFSDGGVSTTA